jgi:hypothetical protein
MNRPNSGGESPMSDEERAAWDAAMVHATRIVKQLEKLP